MTPDGTQIYRKESIELEIVNVSVPIYFVLLIYKMQVYFGVYTRRMYNIYD